jgi:hypothetical protein
VAGAWLPGDLDAAKSRSATGRSAAPLLGLLASCSSPCCSASVFLLVPASTLLSCSASGLAADCSSLLRQFLLVSAAALLSYSASCSSPLRRCWAAPLAAGREYATCRCDTAGGRDAVYWACSLVLGLGHDQGCSQAALDADPPLGGSAGTNKVILCSARLSLLSYWIPIPWPRIWVGHHLGWSNAGGDSA